MILAFLGLAMIFCHIVDDYYLQGWLANGKQKSWWEKNAPDQLYKNDYLMALLMHAFSWSFMIMVPLMLHSNFNLNWMLIFIPINTIIHAIVDDLKANKHKLNLIQDQSIHLLQIIITLSAYAVYIQS